MFQVDNYYIHRVMMPKMILDLFPLSDSFSLWEGLALHRESMESEVFLKWTDYTYKLGNEPRLIMLKQRSGLWTRGEWRKRRASSSYLFVNEVVNLQRSLCIRPQHLHAYQFTTLASTSNKWVRNRLLVLQTAELHIRRSGSMYPCRDPITVDFIFLRGWIYI